MKKIIYALILVLGMSVLASCQKDGDSASIIGTWEVVSAKVGGISVSLSEMYYQFNEDGSCVVVDKDDTYRCTWTLSDDTLTLDGDETTVISLTKDQLIISVISVDDSVITFKRVPDSVIEKYL